MPTLLKRSLILTFSRFANQAIVLLSPILLVRILTVGEYGVYREFLLYAGTIAPFVVFGTKSSLIYFLPRYPERERVWVTQAALFTLAATTVAIIVMFVAEDLIRAHTGIDFVTALQLYVFFNINLDFLETYWLGKKRADLVLFTSATRLVTRMVVVIVAALVTREARLVIASLVVFEFARCVVVFCYASFHRWFTLKLSYASVRLQLSYVAPVGAGTVIEVVNRNVGTLMISALMGPNALAFYATGAFATQVVNVFRGAIADVVFPEIVALRHAVAKDALPLWRKATLWYCILLFPLAALFFYYADAIVPVLFTKEYANAIPIFSAFSFLLYLDCFDFHLPLRVQNANRFFMIGNAIALSVNLGLLYPLYSVFGLLGPAVALIVSRLIFTGYMGQRVARLYAVNIKELVDWSSIGSVVLACAVCAPILVLGKHAIEGLVVRGLVCGVAYLVAYCVMLRVLGVWDVFVILTELTRSISSMMPGSKK